MPHPHLPASVTNAVNRHRTVSLYLAAGLTTAIALSCHWRALESSPLASTVNVAASVAFVVTGLLLFGEPALGSVAAALVFGGILWALTWTAAWEAGPSAVVSSFAYTHFWICLAWGVLRYPTARLHTTGEMVLLAAGVLTIPVYNLFMIGMSRPEWFGYDPGVWWYGGATVADKERFDVLVTIGDVARTAVCAAFVVTVLRRLRRSSAIDRRVLLPVVLSLLTAALLALAGELFVTPRGADVEPVYIAIGAALLTMPLAFATAAVRRQLARARVADLLVTLATPPTLAAVRDVFRRALEDPTAELYLCIPDHDTRPDGTRPDGVPPHVPPHDLRLDANVGSRRLIVPVRAGDGTPLATVSLDPALERNRDVIDVAVSACALALENARLHTDLRVQLDQVEASRTRIVAAGLAERRRLERDLHDGAQQRLLGLATRIGLARAQASDPNTVAVLDGARLDLRAALDELRNLARGIHPAVLSQAGLRPALEAVVESLPVAVRLEIANQRFDTAAETTAYYVICEALTNVVKHADATTATVRVDLDLDLDTAARADNRHVTIEVRDDGKGGANVRDGTGLVGLGDRLAALAGELTIHSPIGGGTRLRARIPCA